MRRLIAFVLPVALLVSWSAMAQLKLGPGASLLEPQQAFRFSARALDARHIEVRFDIANGYYLYRSRFSFAASGNPRVRLGEPEFPPGSRHKDEFFGEVETYRNVVRIVVPVQGEGRFVLEVTSQGCADAGVCYVPMKSKAALRLATSSASDHFSAAAASSAK